MNYMRECLFCDIIKSGYDKEKIVSAHLLKANYARADVQKQEAEE